MSKTFVITGGHHNSALVVARKLVENGDQVVWIGHRQAAAGDTHDSAEYIEVTTSGIPFHNLVAGKTSLTLSNIYKIPMGILRSRQILKATRPDAVISFGGYLGLAVSLAAAAVRIPIFLHEQTVIAGKANKIIAKLARRIYLTWESSLRYYPDRKSLVVGLPLRKVFLDAKSKELFANDKPTILIICGKQGSHTINKLVFAHLTDLLGEYNLIHQTGTSSVTGDYDKAIALKESLKPDLAKRYMPRGYIGETEIAGIMKNVDLVIGRSGAHTTYELGLLGKKAILIPFLHTHGREQLQNAHVLARAGIASILSQSELSYPKLIEEITQSLHRQMPDPLPLPRDATDRLILDIRKLLI